MAVPYMRNSMPKTTVDKIIAILHPFNKPEMITPIKLVSILLNTELCMSHTQKKQRTSREKNSYVHHSC